WWVLLLRGLIAIAFGVFVWVYPGLSLATLVLLFGSYCLADGVLGVWSAIKGRKEHAAGGGLLLWGLVGIGVGILTLVAPGVTALALVFYMAVWAVSTGVLEIMIALRLLREIKGECLLLLAGLASVVFGILVMAQPAAHALTLLWLIAAYAAVLGVLLAVLALRIRAFARALEEQSKRAD
ncbi:MAG: DUF308 domain-containing protein, partial [Candidatus Bipolaricaulota bacterium]|nr:DUF308 domain-containing protein [Candidatus Bipolaricaulota bacterium]